jgi:Domain of unknown function (DUF4261)
MPKGFFTQGLAVLLEQPVDREEIAQLLSAFQIVQRLEGSSNWAMSGPGLVLAFRPEVQGRVTVDVVDRPWPDDMGDPKTAPELFAAWGMGQFGPFTYPGALKRALQQPWIWREAREVVGPHGAFLRVRATYAGGADSPVIPAGYDPLAELRFLTSVAGAVLAHPRALAYFDPNGEVLLSGKLVGDSLAHAAQHGLPPLDLWSGIRLYNLEEGWALMDSVGNGQLDMPDHEAVFRKGPFELPDVDRFLRNMAHYVLENGEVIHDWDTADGPGGVRWRARLSPEPLTSPPRRVLRWFPENESAVPGFLLPRERAAKPAEKPAPEPKTEIRNEPPVVPAPVPAPASQPVTPPARIPRRPWWKIW